MCPAVSLLDSPPCKQCILKEEIKHAAEGTAVDVARCKAGSPRGRLFLSNLVSDFLEIRFAINFSSLSSKNAAGQGMGLPGEGGG